MKYSHPVYSAPLSEEERNEIIKAVSKCHTDKLKLDLAHQAWKAICGGIKSLNMPTDFYSGNNETMVHHREALANNINYWLTDANRHACDKTFTIEEFNATIGENIWDIQISDSLKSIIAGTYDFKVLIGYDDSVTQDERDVNLIHEYNKAFPITLGWTK